LNWEQLHSRDFFPDPRLPLKILRRAPQPPFPMHTHDFSELVIVYDGRAVHYTDAGEEYPVSAGDVFVLQGDRAHSYRDLENLNLVNVVFQPDSLKLPWEELYAIPGSEALFKWEPRLRPRHGFRNRLRLEQKSLDAALALVEDLERELEQKKEGYPFMATAYFMQLCGYLSRCYARDPDPAVQDIHRIGPVLSWLETRSFQPVTVADLTGRFPLSESSLLRLFHRVTGSSPLEYHARMRIRRGCELLRNSEANVTEIAYRLGFRDSNYFSRQFRKIMGVSPLQYRKNHRVYG